MFFFSITEDEPIASPNNEEPQPSTSNTTSTPRPIGQKRAKRINQTKDAKSDVSWNEVLREIKKKNQILERQTKEIQRASDLKIITTPTEGLDEMSKSLLIRLKAELVVKFNAGATEEFLDEEALSDPDSAGDEMITYSDIQSDDDVPGVQAFD